MDGVLETVEGMALDAERAVVTPEHVAFVENFVEGFAVKAVQDAVTANVPYPVVAGLLNKLITDERAHALLKAFEAKMIELARGMADKTPTDFDDKAVEIAAGGMGFPEQPAPAPSKEGG